MSVRAFPWSSLDRTSTRDIRAVAAARRWLERSIRLDELSTHASAVLGCKIEFLIRSLSIETPIETAHSESREERSDDARDSYVGVSLAHAERNMAIESGELELEPSLAVALVSRAIGRHAPPFVDPVNPVSERLAGGAAAVIAAIARRAHRGAPLVVSGRNRPKRDVERAPMSGRVFAQVTVILDDCVYIAYAIVPRDVHDFPTQPEKWSRDSLVRMGDARLRLPVIAASSVASVSALHELEIGDAWLPHRWFATRDRDSMTGPVILGSVERGQCFKAELRGDGTLCISGETQRVAHDEPEDDDMNDAPIDDAAIESLGDVQVRVSVEVGSVELAARDWAALRQGDVIALRRRIGEPVTLRVGGAALARGELVDVDGELGVRISELSNRASPDVTALSSEQTES